MTENRQEDQSASMEPALTTVESCHSTWILDTGRMRFRRVLKGTEVEGRPIATGWRPYYRLEDHPHAKTFTVYLNAAGTRMIRSWRHDAQCVHCGAHMTDELSLEQLRAAIYS
jgi:hypothetical protein